MAIAFLIVVGIQISTTKLRIWFFLKQKIWKVLPYFAGQIWINHPGKSNLPFVSDEARDSLPKQRAFWRKKTTIYAFIFQEVIAHFHDLVDLVVCRWQVSLSNQATNTSDQPTNETFEHVLLINWLLVFNSGRSVFIPLIYFRYIFMKRLKCLVVDKV